MDMEFITKDIPYEKMPVIARAQALAEGELSPPASHPPIARLLNIDARTSAVCTPSDGRAGIEGVVTLSVAYMCAAGGIHGFESATVFRHNIDMDISSGCSADVTAQVSGIDAKVSGGALHIKALVELACMACKGGALQAVADISGGCAERMYGTLSPSVCDASVCEYSLREDARLPRMARKLVGVNGRACVSGVRIESGRAVVCGGISGRAAFCTPEGDLVDAPFELPFEQRMQLPEGASCAFAAGRVLALSAELAADDIAAIECDYELKLYAVSENCEQVLRDAYCQCSSLDMQCETLTAAKRAPVLSSAPLRLTAEVPQSLPPVDKVLLCSQRAQLTEYSIKDGALCVRGAVHAFITYRCSGGELYGFGCKLPFAAELPCQLPDGCALLLDAHAAFISAGTGRQMPLELTLCVQGLACCPQPLCAVTEVERQPREKTFRGLAVYYPARGETLWDVGKRFGVTQQGLRALGADESCSKPILINVRAQGE